uniref:C2H2-type domain-containing protein n=1 Tax=Acrobeloides nanus TaxID=290746 RepID=A0A914CMH9_9BILA
MASLDVDVLKEVFTHLILNDPKDFVRSNNVLIPMERKYRLYLVNRHCYVTMLSLLQEFHIAEVGHNNNQDLVENIASLVNYDIFLWKLDRHGNLGYCFGIDTRLFLYLVRHNLTSCNTLYFDFSYRMAPLRMDVLLFGHLGIKLDKDIFNVYESLARSRRNSLSKIMRTLQNIRGIQKLYFTGSILNFLPEIQKILKNNIYTLQEIKNVPAELFHDPIEGLYFLPREISALATKSLCFWTPDLNLQMILHKIQEFTVTLTATTSICATMSLNTVSTTMSDSKQMLTNTTDQENVTIEFQRCFDYGLHFSLTFWLNPYFETNQAETPSTLSISKPIKFCPSSTRRAIIYQKTSPIYLNESTRISHQSIHEL